MRILIITRGPLRFRNHTRLARMPARRNRQRRPIKRRAQSRRDTQLLRTAIRERPRAAGQYIRRVGFTELDFAVVEGEDIVFDGPLDDAPLRLRVAGYFAGGLGGERVHGVDVLVEVGAEEVAVADHGVVGREDAEGFPVRAVDDEFVPWLLVLDCLPVGFAYQTCSA